MIVDNYSDTEIFLKFLHQILEIDILKSDKSLFPTIWIEVGDGSDRQLSVVETDVLLGSNTTDSSGCDLSVTFTLPCMRAVENSFSL